MMGGDGSIRSIIEALERLRLPEPTVDRFKVRSRRELDDLAMVLGTREAASFGPQSLLQTSIYIDEEVPPGVLRAMKGDEVVADSAIPRMEKNDG